MLNVDCQYCARPFKVKPSKIPQGRGKFCSHTCKVAAQRTGGLNPQGYFVISVNGEQIRQHRWLMERHLGRKLLPTEHVHHKNGKRDDNRIENLEVMTNSEHAYAHNSPSFDVTAAHQMRLHGMSFKDIAKALGVSAGSVWLVLRRRGLISVRPRPRRQQ